MTCKITRLKQFSADESGATAIEYGLIAALIAIVIIAAAGNLGKNLNTVFNKVAANITTGTAS